MKDSGIELPHLDEEWIEHHEQGVHFLQPRLRSINKFNLKEIEKSLSAEGLVSRGTEKIGKYKDFAQRCFAPSEKFLFPRIHEHLNSHEEIANFLFKVAFDAKFAAVAVGDKSSTMTSSLAEACSPTPSDLKDALLRELWRKRQFGARESALLPNFNSKPRPKHLRAPTYLEKREIKRAQSKPYDLRLELSAYLAMRGISREDQVERVAPALDFKSFHSNQAKVFKEVESKLSPLAKKILSFLARLSDKQREALEYAYFRNTEHKPQHEVAKDLGISVHGLRKRIEGANRILISHFSEFKAITKNERDTERRFYRQCDLENWGFFRASSAAIVAPVFQIDLITGARRQIEPTKKSAMATSQNKASEIKAWLRKTMPSHKSLNGMLLDGGASLLIRPRSSSGVGFENEPIELKYNEAQARGKIAEKQDQEVQENWASWNTCDERNRQVEKLAGFDPKKVRLRLMHLRQTDQWEREEFNLKRNGTLP